MKSGVLTLLAVPSKIGCTVSTNCCTMAWLHRIHFTALWVGTLYLSKMYYSSLFPGNQYVTLHLHAQFVNAEITSDTMPTNSFQPVTSEYSNRTDWLFNMLGVDWEVCNCSSRHGKHEYDGLFRSAGSARKVRPRVCICLVPIRLCIRTRIWSESCLSEWNNVINQSIAFRRLISLNTQYWYKHKWAPLLRVWSASYCIVPSFWLYESDEFR